MLKTTDGRTIMKVIKDFEAQEPFMLNDSKKSYSFDIDGSTSLLNGEDGWNIHVEVDDIWLTFTGGNHEKKIPNYDHERLEFAIVCAAELLWFEWDM